MKPKGVTTQMKALDEYFLMVVFMLLLNIFYVVANFMLEFEQRHGSEICLYFQKWSALIFSSIEFRSDDITK